MSDVNDNSEPNAVEPSRRSDRGMEGEVGQPQPTEFVLNGEEVSFAVDPQKPLLYVLRNDAELNGPKFGCGLAQCGSCTVVVDGDAILSCVTPVSDVQGGEVTTTRGLSGEDGRHSLQAAFIEEQAAQCGFCIHGMMMRAVPFLEGNENPSDDEIEAALAPNLCRCGTHTEIVNAVRRASGGMENTGSTEDA